MNECPDTIDKKWDPRWDARPELLRLVGPEVDPDTVDRVLDALLTLVGTRQRTCITGFGVWTRRPYHRRTPDGKLHSVLRICFSLTGAAKRRLYGGRHLPKEPAKRKESR